MRDDSGSPKQEDRATIWTMIRGAAAGDDACRSAFAQAYVPLVRRYLGQRWRGTLLSSELEDAVQEVFLECLRADGVLANASADRPGGFRAFLFGAIRNVARRHEGARSAARRLATETRMPADVLADQEELGEALDREWARCLMRQAAEHHRRTALARGASTRQGVELLRLRFEEGLPIRAIAARWGEEPAAVHRLYRRARETFRRSLSAVVAFHHPDATDLEAECRQLLALLQNE